MAVSKIISGGQTGADQGALLAGRDLGLVTGGWAPRGWRTERGPCPDLANFGLQQHGSSGYPPRTRQNVKDSDGTLVFGDPGSPGCTLTLRWCQAERKPAFVVFWREGPVQEHLAFRAWLSEIAVLNVAGNRESRRPGITAAVRAFLRLNLTVGLGNLPPSS